MRRWSRRSISKYTPGEAQKLVLAAVAPLGADYQATIGRAFDSRWIDLYPNEGKALGRLLGRRRVTTSIRTC